MKLLYKQKRMVLNLEIDTQLMAKDGLESAVFGVLLKENTLSCVILIKIL